jgi:tripartite-type tricarboxylate transporter receptor subunit TctC
MRRRFRIATLSFCLLLAVSLFSLISVDSLKAQEKFPSKPIKFIIPYAPGSATDTVARIMNEELRQIRVVWKSYFLDVR